MASNNALMLTALLHTKAGSVTHVDLSINGKFLLRSIDTSYDGYTLDLTDTNIIEYT